MRKVEQQIAAWSAWRMLTTCAALVLIAATAAPLAAQARATSKARVADISPRDLPIVARTVRSVRVEPKTITLRVGQTVGLDVITVTVVDSSGRVRGRLADYDFSIAPGQPASVVPRRITGVRAGTTELTVRYPRMAWTARKDPRAEAKVKVVVVP